VRGTREPSGRICRAAPNVFFLATKEERMALGFSLLLAAAGAVLIWAVDRSVQGIELRTIGWILLAVGAVGIVVSLLVAGTRGRRDAPA
jgi:hypothetical protein